MKSFPGLTWEDVLWKLSWKNVYMLMVAQPTWDDHKEDEESQSDGNRSMSIEDLFLSGFFDD